MGSYLRIASILFGLCLLGYSANAEVFTVQGAPGSDIIAAFLKAFQSACAAPAASQVVIPKGEFKLGEIVMTGPCKAPIEFTLQGTVKADGQALGGKERWVVFERMVGFKLDGPGAFDGEGNVLVRKQSYDRRSL